MNHTKNQTTTERAVQGLTVSGNWPNIQPLLTRIPSTAAVTIIHPGAAEPPRVLLTVGQKDVERHTALTPEDAERLGNHLIQAAHSITRQDNA